MFFVVIHQSTKVPEGGRDGDYAGIADLFAWNVPHLGGASMQLFGFTVFQKIHKRISKWRSCIHHTRVARGLSASFSKNIRNRPFLGIWTWFLEIRRKIGFLVENHPRNCRYYLYHITPKCKICIFVVPARPKFPNFKYNSLFVM